MNPVSGMTELILMWQAAGDDKYGTVYRALRGMGARWAACNLSVPARDLPPLSSDWLSSFLFCSLIGRDLDNRLTVRLSYVDDVSGV